MMGAGTLQWRGAGRMVAPGPLALREVRCLRVERAAAGELPMHLVLFPRPVIGRGQEGARA